MIETSSISNICLNSKPSSDSTSPPVSPSVSPISPSNESPAMTSESRQTDFWFNDGSVILVSGNVAFKVHKGQLSRHSEVFGDLLSVPQPPDEATFENCYIVELHDSPVDLWYLLKALYDGLYFKQLCSSDFANITGVLRLSSKYFIEHLRERCLSRLLIDWPCTLAAWDSREIEATDSFGRYSPRSRFAHPILVINFAREMGLNHILPCAFYDLCRYGPSKIVAGVPSSDGSCPIKLGPKTTESRDAHSYLSLSDLRIVLLGRERAQRVVATFIEEELNNREPASDCHNREYDDGERVCRESFYLIMLNLLRSIGGLASGRDCDPLFSLTQAANMMNRTDFSDGNQFCSLKLCAPCRTDFSVSVKNARERVWLQIPSWFGMEDFTGNPKNNML